MQKSHNGFALNLILRLLVESIAGHFQKVVYSKDIPYFSIMDNLEDELITKLLYTKSDVWSYEDEYRLTKIHKPNSAFQFDPQALTGVYFGCKMSVEHQIEIIDIVQQTYPWVKLYNMNLGKRNLWINNRTDIFTSKTLSHVIWKKYKNISERWFCNRYQIQGR